MIYILYFALAFMFLTTLVLIRNRVEFKSISDEIPSLHNHPKVSICIPARNEEDVIERCVTSALKQNYPNFEVLVLNDNSTDKTGEILDTLSNVISNLIHLKGEEKPEDWLGKPWACHQLSQKATGEILIFIDADVWLEHHSIEHAVYHLQKYDALTIWPEQEVKGFWENLIVPTIYFSLLTMLPVKYVERSPKWMPSPLRPIMNTKFTAGCGQFFAFNKNVYDSFGGHERVKNKVVEDMALSKRLKESNFKLLMLNGIQGVHCRMYTSGSEIWNGFQKNFLAGFGNSFEFIFMGVLHFLFFLFPIFTLTNSIIVGDPYLQLLSMLVLGSYIIQRLLLNIWFGWSWYYSLLHPLAVLWFQILGIKCLINSVIGKKTSWKGRPV